MFCDVLATYPRLSMQRPILLLAAVVVVVSSPFLDRTTTNTGSIPIAFFVMRDFEASFRQADFGLFRTPLTIEPVSEATMP